MRCIIHNITDPYFNIASEEYLLKFCSEDVFMLYINRPSIIVGKHQNAFAEINMDYVTKHDIPVIRRLSGGGTVFHDLGNLNFTFIRNSNSGKQIDFRRFTTPILEVLHQLNIPASFSGRNDLIIDGLKFSGNAEHVYKNRTLHHGTLLFSSTLENLREAIRVKSDQYLDKAVKSVRSPVVNINTYTEKTYFIENFRDDIVRHIRMLEKDCLLYSFSETDLSAIQALVATKYSTWDWNYAYSPRCIIQKNLNDASGNYIISLEIDKGRILNASITLNHEILHDIIMAIRDMPYDTSTLAEKLAFTGNAKQWIEHLF